VSRQGKGATAAGETRVRVATVRGGNAYTEWMERGGMKAEVRWGASVGLVGVLAVVLATGVAGAQQAGSQQTPSKQSPAQNPNQPVPLTTPGVTPPALQEGQTTVIVDKPLTKAQQKQLLSDANEIFEFVSHDTGLPIEHSVKKVFITRDKVNSELRKKFDEDKSNKRMERGLLRQQDEDDEPAGLGAD